MAERKILIDVFDMDNANQAMCVGVIEAAIQAYPPCVGDDPWPAWLISLREISVIVHQSAQIAFKPSAAPRCADKKKVMFTRVSRNSAERFMDAMTKMHVDMFDRKLDMTHLNSSKRARKICNFTHIRLANIISMR